MSMLDTLTQDLTGQSVKTTTTEIQGTATAAGVWATVMLILVGLIAWKVWQ